MSDKLEMTAEESARAYPLVAGLKRATLYGLQEEFLAAFLQGLGVTLAKVEEAVWHAMREWDL